MMKFICLLILVIICTIPAIKSASVTAYDDYDQAEKDDSNASEEISVPEEDFNETDIELLDDKSTTEGLNNDMEQQLRDIFVVNFVPKETTEGSNESDEFELINTKVNDKHVSFGRRTDFRVIRNCPCIKNNHCASTKSC